MAQERLCLSLSIPCNLFWIGLTETPHFVSLSMCPFSCFGVLGGTYQAGTPGMGLSSLTWEGEGLEVLRMDQQDGGERDEERSNGAAIACL
jgi:hypothetical protein